MRSSPLLLLYVLLSCTPARVPSTVTSDALTICYDDAFKDLEQLDILGAVHDWQVAMHYHVAMRAVEIDGSTERAWGHCYVTILRVESHWPAWRNVDTRPHHRVLAIHEHPFIWIIADRVALYGDTRTVVGHELGHAFGLREGEGLMNVVLQSGEKPSCSHAVEAAYYLGGRR